jgi:hypothetical protein
LSVLDPESGRVCLLEPWEHAVLVLCDGTRTARQILEVLDHPIDGETIDLKTVKRTVSSFELQRLLEEPGQQKEEAGPSAGPRTLAGLQQAFREWHKDPAKTGQILSGIFTAPFVDPGSKKLPVGLEPTVALPEDEPKQPSAPVAIGTQLVVGEQEEGSDARAIKSLLDSDEAPGKLTKSRDQDVETQVGSLEPEPSYRDGPPRPHPSPDSAEVSSEDFEEEELELGGKLSELLAAVDNDFAEVEKRERELKQKKGKTKKDPPPLGKPIGGVAEVPRAKSLAKPASNVWLADVDQKPATRVILPDADATEPRPKVPRAPTLPPGPDIESTVPDEPTMRSIKLGEAGLRPTMVGLPPQDGTAPQLVSPPRGSSAGDWVGAVVGAEPTPEQRNVTPARPQRPVAPLRSLEVSEPVLTIEDTAPFLDVETEGRIQTVDPRPKKDKKNGKNKREEPTTNSSDEHIAPGRAREVFERLRKAGHRARAAREDDVEKTDRGTTSERPKRRRERSMALRFDEALRSLTAGELDVALKHFKRLRDKMPSSKRLTAFIEAIQAVKTGTAGFEDGEQTAEDNRLLQNFEGVLEEAVAYGRCPACFSMVAKNFDRCFACGFALSP